MKIEINDEMVEAAMKSWFGEFYEDGRVLGSAAQVQIEAEDGMRQIIEAVAPLIASRALERAASVGYVVCAGTRHMKLGNKVSEAILALKDAE